MITNNPLYRAIFFIIFLFSIFSIEAQTDDMRKVAEKIQWFGQAAIKIETEGKTVYIDPYKLIDKDVADLVLITHHHQDHMSLEDLRMICTEKTIIVAPKKCEERLQELTVQDIVLVKPDVKIKVAGFNIQVVPAYNVVKKMHPKKDDLVGYVIEIDGVKVYHAGDTERIPEMKEFTADVALLPLGQTYTMLSVEDAANSARDVQAKIAIPIHYGMYEGKPNDAEIFKSMLKDDIEVIIKKAE